MSWARQIKHLLDRLLDPHRTEAELDEEVQGFFETMVERRMSEGMTQEQAQRAARLKFDSPDQVKEKVMDARFGAGIETIVQDLRYAVRALRRQPAFTAIAILTLAVGIGANTAIFSIVETAMLRLLPVSHPEELVELLQKYPGEPRGNGYWPGASYEYFRDNNHVFSAVIGTTIDNRIRFVAEGSAPEMGVGEYVTGNYFVDLGVKPAIGRLIGPGDNSGSPGGAVAVVSWSQWIDRFHKDPNILGKRIVVQDVPATVIGVTPRAFAGLRVEAKTDVWLFQKPTPQSRLTLLARLKPAMTLEQARAEMVVLFRFTIGERSASSKDPLVRQLSVQVEPAGNGLATVRDRYGKPLTILMIGGGMLLLLTCVNLASMLLARAASREREMAVRTSLGASGIRLLRQVLTESLMLSAAGTLLGAAIAYFGASALLRILASGREHERVYLRVQPDLHILLFAAGVAVVAAVAFGSAPAWSAFRINPVLTLRQTGSVGETPLQRLFAKGLVATQVSLSLLLLSSATLFIANLISLEQADLGFHRDHVLLVALDPSSSVWSGEQISRLYQELLSRLERIPGVRSVSLAAAAPLSGAGASGFATVQGFTERPEDRRWISISYVAPGYFETLGTQLLSGREFALDDQVRSNVAVVNQAFARYYFGGRDPIGRHITLDHVTLTREPMTYEIVGVSGDANYYEIREAPPRTVFLPAFRVRSQTFLIRTNIRAAPIADEVGRTFRDAAPTIPVARITTLSDQIDASIVPERLLAMLSGFFGALAALLAGIGLYGLLAYSVERRTNEIGLRAALGASAGDVTWLVMRDSLATVFAGLALGLLIAIWGRSVAARLVPNLPIQTAAPFALATVAIIGVALLASYIPARRAANVDPLEAVRHE